MGFRSDVYIVIRKEAILEKCLFSELPSLLSSPITDDSEPDNMYWYFEYIKWYEDYSDIAKVLLLLNSLQDEDYGFFQLNEDNTSETKGHPWDYDIELLISVDRPSFLNKDCYPENM